MALADHSPERLLRRKIEQLEHDLGTTQDRARAAEKALHVLHSTAQDQPKWLKKVPTSKVSHHGTPVLMLSDLHLDEKVDYDEMRGINKYNRAIAEQRLDRIGAKTINILRDYWTGTIYDGIVVILGGDIFSGNIHDELRESNEDTMLGSVAHWIPLLAQQLHRLAEEFGKVHVVCIPGNHGRMTPKKRHKQNARDNFDWFIGVQLSQMFAEDKRITFNISAATDVTFDLYGWRVLAFHGDEAGGGNGIGGIWPPIMRMVAKKQSAHAALGRRFDFACMGHWHQLTWGPGDSFMINGSLKGYDEFAKNMNFAPEIAQQGLWVMSPERRITWRAGVVAEDQASEGWTRS